ncbi:uncharacterized protein LOC132015486 [Mustela nigripes]|uniref:uncharacterized protein LOC132015486 n=1 Tax=Mustela nigripes TaxID=77151 RepID=UPI00281504E4|nr:uncharacterized protein LOC132015486 [Mustela nigripes]
MAGRRPPLPHSEAQPRDPARLPASAERDCGRRHLCVPVSSCLAAFRQQHEDHTGRQALLLGLQGAWEQIVSLSSPLCSLPSTSPCLEPLPGPGREGRVCEPRGLQDPGRLGDVAHLPVTGSLVTERLFSAEGHPWHARGSTHLGSGEPARAGSPPEAGHPDPVPISPKPLKIRQRGEGACTSLPLRPAESTSWKLDWTGSLFHGCQERGSQRKPCRARSQPFQLAATLVTAGRQLTPEPPLAGSERWPGAFWLHSPHLPRQAEDSQAGRQESPGQGQQRVSGPSRGQRTVGGQRRSSSAGRACRIRRRRRPWGCGTHLGSEPRHRTGRRGCARPGRLLLPGAAGADLIECR